jgi:hypothetical protein
VYGHEMFMAMKNWIVRSQRPVWFRSSKLTWASTEFQDRPYCRTKWQWEN